jgi:predicted transcriptional regulator of viral defense system
LDTHPVFTLAEAAQALTPSRGKLAAVERLKYAARKGRVKLVAREVYAAVPPGTDQERFEPDRYLVAATVRPDAVFSHHAALELLGAAHSDWSGCTVFTRQRRTPLGLGSVRIEFLPHPPGLRRRRQEDLGCRSIDRLGRALRVTGAERTLLDGFRQPPRAGGLRELVESAAGFGVLHLDRLHNLLTAYDEKGLWAAAGWFLERYQRTFFVPDDFLRRVEARSPRSPLYLVRSQRGGTLARRWNLIVPSEVENLREPGER